VRSLKKPEISDYTPAYRRQGLRNDSTDWKGTENKEKSA
jgi:hypothetical protein